MSDKVLFCRHYYSVRNVVDMYVSQGSTANLCAIDVSKAFDRVNHFALLSKLMKRLVHVELLILLAGWLVACYSCVRSWDNSSSEFFYAQLWCQTRFCFVAAIVRSLY